MQLDPRFIATAIFALAFDILMPPVVAVLIHRRFGVSWRYFGLGALIFLLSQLLTRVPATQVLGVLLAPTLQADPFLLSVWLVVLSLTAGLFEETGRYLGYRYLIREARSWSRGLMFGAGHGGLESMLLVGGLLALQLVNIIALANLDLTSLQLTPEQLQQIELAKRQIETLAWYTPLFGAYERVLAMALHLALSILVLQVFARGSWLWYWLAVGFHTLANVAAVFVARAYGVELSEAVSTLFAAIGLWIIFRLRPPSSRSTSVAAETPAPTV